MPQTHVTNVAKTKRIEAKARKAGVTESKQTAAIDDDVSEYLKKFNASWKYCSGSWHDRWTRNYKLYHGERVEVGYEGISDVFIPMVFSTIETLKAGMFGSKPRFNYTPPRNRPDQKTDILNAAVDMYWEMGQWSIKVMNTGHDFFNLGTGVDYWFWNVDRPDMLNVPIRDFIIDPTYTGNGEPGYAGRRYLTTKEELESFEIVDMDNPVEVPVTDEEDFPILDPETQLPQTETTYNLKKKYRNLDQLDEAIGAGENTAKGTAGENTDKQEKDHFYGSTLDDTSGQVEVIEIWTTERVISIANRRVIIEDTENYFLAKQKANGVERPRGLLPFAWARNYVDKSLFYAKGEVDFIAGLQEMLNDVTNQNIDSITYILNQMYTIDPASAHLQGKVQNVPGATYVAPKDAIAPIQQRNVPPEAFNERMNIKNEIREATASNEVVKGVGDVDGGKATATEINAQIAGAGQRINLKITQLENEYFHRMATIVLELMRCYVTEKQLIRIVGKDGIRWEEFDPADFAEGDYQPHVQLDIRIQNQKAEEATNAKEMYAAFMGDMDVNQQWLKKKVLAAGFGLDPDEVEEAMQPNPMQPGMDSMTGMPTDPMAAGMPPADMPMEDQMLGVAPPAAPAAPAAPELPPEEDTIIDPATGEEIALAELIP